MCESISESISGPRLLSLGIDKALITTGRAGTG
jgi:hypothetical protein